MEELLRESASVFCLLCSSAICCCAICSPARVQPLTRVFSNTHGLFLVLWWALGMLCGSLISVGRPLFYEGYQESFMRLVWWDPPPHGVQPTSSGRQKNPTQPTWSNFPYCSSFLFSFILTFSLQNSWCHRICFQFTIFPEFLQDLLFLF